MGNMTESIRALELQKDTFKNSLNTYREVFVNTLKQMLAELHLDDIVVAVQDNNLKGRLIVEESSNNNILVPAEIKFHKIKKSGETHLNYCYVQGLYYCAWYDELEKYADFLAKNFKPLEAL